MKIVDDLSGMQPVSQPTNLEWRANNNGAFLARTFHRVGQMDQRNSIKNENKYAIVMIKVITSVFLLFDIKKNLVEIQKWYLNVKETAKSVKRYR